MCFYNNAWLETENASAPPFLIYSTPADHTDKHIIKVKGENQTGSIYTHRGLKPLHSDQFLFIYLLESKSGGIIQLGRSGVASSWEQRTSSLR